MCKKIVLFLITICCFAVSANAANKQFTLVIDAGHGGKDAGAVGAVTQEKKLTLKFALAFGRLVEQNCPDVKVVYTRKTDKFVELHRRADIANSCKADLFISIHINSLAKGHRIHGFQTYTLGKSRRTGKKNGVQENLEVAKRENSVIYLEKNYKQTYKGYDPNSPESNILFEFIQDKNMDNSIELAKYMQCYVCKATGRVDLGAHQDNLAVLRLTSMAGCLIELGFISSPDEERFMNSASATDKYARGIYNAFIAYRKRHGATRGLSFIEEPSQEQPETAPRKEVASAPRRELASAPRKEVVEAPKEGTVVEVPSEVAEAPRKETVEVADKQQAIEPPIQQQPVETPAEPLAMQAVVAQPDSSVDRPLRENPQPAPVPVADKADDQPIFKVQILVAQQRLKANDARLKGQKGADCYREGNFWKYTVGASSNYNEIYRLRKQLLNTFPEAFIIAFKREEKVGVQEAIREFLANKKKQH